MCPRAEGPAVAICPWGNVIEDWLAPLGLSVEDFVERMDGGWIFGFVRALESAGIRPVLVCVSRAVVRPQRRVHRASGATIWLVPPPRTYRLLRVLRDPYAWRAGGALGGNWARQLAGLPIWLAAPYLSTPVVAITRVLRDEGCEALLCQEYEEGRFDLMLAACRLAGVRVFATYQGGNHCRTPIERLVRPRAVRAADGLLVGAEVERERLRSVYSPSPDRLHDVPNPVEAPGNPTGAPNGADRRSAARKLLGLADDDVVVAWVGRVDLWQKGLDVLVDAWSRCCRARPGRPLRLLLLGSGADAPRLEALIAESGVAGILWRNEFVLDRSLVAMYHHAADVYVHSSRHEGFAVAPMEAMAAGLPVVATDAPGIADLFGGEGVGTVVPRDDPTALADALGEMVDDLDSARAQGTRARASVVRRFGTEAVGRQLASVLLSRVAGPNRFAEAVPDPCHRPGQAPAPSRPTVASRGPLPASVVIPTIGRGSLLKACLHSVLECAPGPSEVIVVDQSRGDEVHQVVRSLATDVVQVVDDRGRGIGRATNAGIAAARNSTVFVTHDDCTVAGGWIAAGARLAEQHPGALLTGRVLPPDGSPYVPSTIADPKPRDWTGTVCAGQLYPANMVADRGGLLSFGGFDERRGLWLAAEDNDLCFRWLSSGRPLRYEPSLVVWHHDWRTPDQLVRTHVAYAHGQGAFYAKHLALRDRQILPLLSWDLSHGFAAPLAAMLHGKPRWQEPYWEMNLSLISGIARALPEALVLARQARWSARS